MHFGSRTDGELDATTPLREEHLLVKDLVEDAWSMKSRTIRLRTDDNVNAMRGLVQSKDDHWLRLVAIAHFRAEPLKDPAMNLARAGRGFESNPFRWYVPEEWRSQLAVTFLWSWQSALEGPLYSFATSRLHHVLERRLIPIPSEVSQRDVELYNYLLSAAEHETQATKAPCLYLGVERSPGCYEPDPANWQEEPERKSHCHVWFEWQHVRHGDAPQSSL